MEGASSAQNSTPGDSLYTDEGIDLLEILIVRIVEPSYSNLKGGRPMQRRRFLQTLGVATSGAALDQSSQAPTAHAANLDTETREPRVFFYDDGRHASPLYQFAPPLTPEDYVFAVDQLVGSGVDTLFHSAGLEGGIVQYDSQVAQKWGDNVDVWSHEIFYRASRNLQQLIADGHDPMKLLCDRCHEKEFWFLPTAPVCIVGGQRDADVSYGRKSDFVLDNPQFYVGQHDSDPRAKLLGRFFQPTRMNFLHPEVRNERFLIFEELLTRYETDGIELDLSIDNEFGPFCKFGEVEQLASLLTQWITDLRAVARKAEARQGRRKRIYIRIPASSEKSWRMVGFDVATWVKDDLVDGLVCLSPYKKETPTDRIVLLDQDLDLSPAVELTRGTPCRVLAALTTYLGRTPHKNATAPMIWAAAANAYDRGTDALGIADGMWAPNGWPWTSEEYETVRLLGHPDLLATADKVYRAHSGDGGADIPKGLFPVAGPLLPRSLAQGASLEVPLRIADDLAHRHQQEKVAAVHLRLRLGNFDTDLNEARVELNGRLVPTAILQKLDRHFRVIPNGIAGPYGYVLDYLLPPEFYPAQRDNTVKVTLVKRDPKLKPDVVVYDIDCSIRYHTHRHFEREAIDS